MFKKKRELVKVKKEVAKPKESPTPEMLIAKAIDGKLSIETLERLLAMRTQLKDEQAKEAYFRDLASFQGECPVIKKTRPVMNKDKKTVRYKYASLDDIVGQVGTLLQKYCFSYTIQTKFEKDPPILISDCILHHELGHSESSEFEIPVDANGYMNEPQQYATASAYGKKYAFVNVTGILTGDEDNDAQDYEQPEPPEKKSEPVKPKEKSVGYKKIEEQIYKDLKNPLFTGKIILDDNPADLDSYKKRIPERLASKVVSLKILQDTADVVKRMLEQAEWVANNNQDVDEKIGDKDLFSGGLVDAEE